MALFRGIRDRFNAAIGGVIVGFCLLTMGGLLAFVISPSQAVEWRQIQSLPELDSAAFVSVASGEEVVITGTLSDNPELLSPEYVAYRIEEWILDTQTEEEDTFDGDWVIREEQIPSLTITVSGGVVNTLPAGSGINLGGNLHENLQMGPGPESANFDSQELPRGSTRTQGLFNGDLITVVGKKATTGGLVPDRIYVGDRVQLVDDIRSGARAAFKIGLGMMICAPIAGIAIIMAGIFGRKK